MFDATASGGLLVDMRGPNPDHEDTRSIASDTSLGAWDGDSMSPVPDALMAPLPSSDLSEW